MLRLELRRDASRAPPPSVFPYLQQQPCIAFDCYNPDAAYSSSCPGFPDFSIAVTLFNPPTAFSDDCRPGLGFADLRALLATSVGIPLKIATVSDSGTVVMFGVTDFGVPTIAVCSP